MLVALRNTEENLAPFQGRELGDLDHPDYLLILDEEVVEEKEEAREEEGVQVEEEEEEVAVDNEEFRKEEEEVEHKLFQSFKDMQSFLDPHSDVIKALIDETMTRNPGVFNELLAINFSDLMYAFQQIFMESESLEQTYRQTTGWSCLFIYIYSY